MSSGLHRRLKLEDLAKAAGVSRATAWRALNRPERVTEKTAARVRAAIRQTGYIPDMVARTFRTNEDTLLSLIVPSVTYGFSRAMREIGGAAGQAGFEVLLGVTDYDSRSEFRIVQNMLGRRVPAMILTGTDQLDETRALLKNAGIPVVQLWEVDGEPIETMVGFSNFEAGRAAAHHLAGRGCRCVGAVYLPTRSRSRRRLEGFRAGLAEAELTSAVVEAAVPDHPEGVRLAMEEIYRIDRSTDGIFLNGDRLAIQALQWCRSSGRRVPQDVAILGWGNREYGLYAEPPLSTVDIPEAEIGATAAALVYRQLNGETLEKRRYDLGFRIIERETA